MQNLIKELENPTHDSNGISVGPTSLQRRAANAIKQLVAVKLQNQQVIMTMEKELNYFRNKEEQDAKNNTSSSTTDPKSEHIANSSANPAVDGQ